jgi:cell wall-associated NlpC family hydrolase
MLLFLVALGPLTASSQPPSFAQAMVARARELVGTPYVLGGRRPGTALDCQGLVFFAAQAVRGCSWRSYSVYPTVTVKTGELGVPVPGLSPVSTAALDVASLKAGDVVLLLADVENPAEAALTELGGVSQWVWHVGLASGDGKWINADSFTGRVQEVPLKDYLEEHDYAGVWVLRMKDGPRPTRCR